ncbi:protein of unknown function [Aquiflexum balticum DSM 16537]|uniref:DUF4221 domain-containing protein n=1 Tax=Aquiflexum balticum DSM 16537 TaxID=758820 RepID=A0A1W2H3U8_9BACT|nr:DUF4221 family protein [Aquiflexum balticum]SMD43444.1 protein of unknown function [Aquiflexum balticum DSM 16537]
MKKVDLRNLGFFLAVIGISFSCSPRIPKSPEFFTGDLHEYIVDTIYLEKDTKTKILPSDLTYFEIDGEEFLYAFVNYRLLKYSFPGGELLAVQEFEKEGPDGIGTWIAGSLITEDGLFFISDNKEIVRTDFKGKVIDRNELPLIEEDRLSANFNTMNGNSMTWISSGKKLIVLDVPFVLMEQKLSYEDWVWVFDFDTGVKSTISFSYPEKYQAFLGDPELGVYSHKYVSGKHLISFPATDSLLVLEGEKEFWVDGKSSKQLMFEKGKVEPQGEWMVFLPNLNSSRYKWLLYDPYRKIILRHLVIGAEERNDLKLEKNSFIILDEQLSKKGELFFTNEMFSGFGFFTPQGLYLKLVPQQSDDYEGYVRILLDL